MENGAANGRLYFEDFEVDSLKRTLLRNGRPVPLNPKAFDLLLTLVEHSGETLSKQNLLDLVWAEQFVEEKNLTVHVAALRKALGEGKNEHRFIVTVPGNGYKFVADMKQSSNGRHVTEDVKPIEASSVGLEHSKFSGLSGRRVAIGISLVVLLLALIAGGLLWQNRRKLTSVAAPPSQNISIKRLTSDGLATNTTLSPDGKLFVYSHVDGENQSLWMGHVNGGEPIQIRPPLPVNYQDLKFSPDAASLFYTLADDLNVNGGVYKMPVLGGLAEKIEDRAYNITFSPSGKQFAFIRGGTGNPKPVLVVTDSDGRNDHVIAASPDARKFVGQDVAWSPDGTTIAVGAMRSDTNNDYEVYAVNTSDGAVKPLTKAAWSRISAIAWLADSAGLVIVAQKTGSTLSQLWSVAFPGGEVKHLVSDLSLYGSTIFLGQDQNSLLTVQALAQSNIWIAPTDDLAQAKQITFGSIGRMDGWYGLRWTTDGRIAYTAGAGENNTIWTMSVGGGDQKQLIPSEGNNIFPGVSMDARFFVFESNRSGSFAVWRSNGDGGDIVKLTDADTAAQPDISPDGRWIVYISSPESSGEMWRMASLGGDAVKLEDGSSWPKISPDSRFIACGYLVDEKPKLAIFSIDGGEPLQLFDLPPRANLRLSVHWTPDGKAITYRDWISGIWRQELTGAEPHKLKGLPNEKLYAYDWSPDGKFLAYTRGNAIRDVVLISDFR